MSQELPWRHRSAQLHRGHLGRSPAAARGASAQSVTRAVSVLRGGRWGCTGFTPLSKRGQLVEALVLATCLLTGSGEGDPS